MSATREAWPQHLGTCNRCSNTYLLGTSCGDTDHLPKRNVMTEYKKDALVRYMPGSVQGSSYIGTIISDGVVKFGGTDCVRIREADGGTDYIAVSHVKVIGWLEGKAAHVQTFKDALDVSTLNLDDVIIEDREESLRAAKIIKGFRGVKL